MGGAGEADGKKEKQTRILTFVGVKKVMLCTCRRAQPGKHACLSGWDHLGMFPGPQGERTGLGGQVYFLLIFIVISNMEV